MLDGVEMEVMVKKKPQKDGSKVTTASGSQIYIIYLKPPGGGQLNGTDYIRSNDPYKMVKRESEVYSRAWRVCMGASVGACMGVCVRARVRAWVRVNDSSLCPIDCSAAGRAHDESRGRTGRGGAGRGPRPGG